MDVDAFDGDYRTSGKTKLKLYEVEFSSLSQADVEGMMKQEVESISGIFGVEASGSIYSNRWMGLLNVWKYLQHDIASLLLRYFNWNKEKLIEKYMDNSTGINTAAGIAQPEKAPEPSRSSSRPAGVTRSSRRTTASTSKSGKTRATLERISPPVEEPQQFVCPICYDDSQTQTLALACGHRFCTECWNMYVVSKVKTEAEQWITCMAEDCSIVAPESFIKTCLRNDEPTWVRYQELLVRHFVAANHSFKYCPYPSCTYTVSCPSAASKSALTTIVPIVNCGASTSHKFCFGCNVDSDHRPVVCGVAKLWLQKCQDDSETANWIKSNTKECSKCQSTIEKNGGCKCVNRYRQHNAR